MPTVIDRSSTCIQNKNKMLKCVFVFNAVGLGVNTKKETNVAYGLLNLIINSYSYDSLFSFRNSNQNIFPLSLFALFKSRTTLQTYTTQVRHCTVSCTWANNKSVLILIQIRRLTAQTSLFAMQTSCTALTLSTELVLTSQHHNLVFSVLFIQYIHNFEMTVLPQMT